MNAELGLRPARFDIYMKLLEVNSLYFWVVSAELRREPYPTEIATKLRELSWRTADKLREADEVEHLEEILTVLLSNSFATARSRAEALDNLAAKLGRLVNPRYSKAIARVSNANIAGIVDGQQSNAPGNLDQFGGPA